MQYRKFGKLDWEASVLGFGCMRLPTADGNPLSGQIVTDEAIGMIRYAIDHGVNYIDTAYTYHVGQSEVVVGKALQDGYRTKVKLVTKSPVRLIKQAKEFDSFLNEQLAKLQTERIDFYLLHGLNRTKWREIVLKHNLLERAEAAIRDGRIGALGFSFHDKYELFTEIVDGYDKWAFCQIQYNYLDIEKQAGVKGLKYAAAKGLPIVVMEPLLGGKLTNPPRAVQELFDGAAIKRSPADWALQWVWDQPEVAVVLSGMGALDQVKENLISADRSSVNSLGLAEQQLIAAVREQYLTRTAIACTGCGYCLPCPNGVMIPRNLVLYNDAFIHEALNAPRLGYAKLRSKNEQASACIQCKVCEAKCPQQIPISEWLPKVHTLLG